MHRPASASSCGTAPNEVLLLTGRADLPRQICIYWMDDAARGATLAGSPPACCAICRQNPSSSAPRLLAAAMRAAPPHCAPCSMPARKRARRMHWKPAPSCWRGDMPQVLNTWLTTLDAPLLVLGASNASQSVEMLAGIQQQLPSLPVLLVYRETA